MSVQTWTYVIVGITFALYIGIAIWSKASSTKDFYVAGGGVSPWANGMATAADWMSAASFISMAGIIAFAGYDGWRCRRLLVLGAKPHQTRIFSSDSHELRFQTFS